VTSPDGQESRPSLGVPTPGPSARSADCSVGRVLTISSPNVGQNFDGFAWWPWSSAVPTYVRSPDSQKSRRWPSRSDFDLA
jgi:hypothetical protein